MGARRPVRFAARGAGAVAVALVCLLVGEIFARVAVGPPAAFIFSGSFRDRRTSWDLVYSVNEDSRRVSCIDPSALRSRRRIAVIGDSFVFGQGVADCHDFSALLNVAQEALHFENLGNIGSGPDVYRLVARDLVDENYDGVLLVFYGNDFLAGANPSWLGRIADESSVFSLFRKFRRSLVVAERMREVDAELAKPQQRLTVHNNLAALIQGQDPAYPRRCVDPDPTEIARFEASLDRILDALHGKVPRERIWVTVVPQGSVVSRALRRFVVGLGGEVATFGQPGEAYRIVHRLAVDRGLGFIGTFEAFVQDGDDLYWEDDLHWNERGHARMASVLAAEFGISLADAPSAMR